MKKLLIIFFFLLISNQNSFAFNGFGELKLSDRVINNFQQYLNFRKPTTFWVTEDGSGSYGWRCPHSRCVATGSSDEKNKCERAYGKKCAIFAQRRSVKWKNETTKDIKGNAKKFYSTDSFEDVKMKLKLLGFVD